MGYDAKTGLFTLPREIAQQKLETFAREMGVNVELTSTLQGGWVSVLKQLDSPADQAKLRLALKAAMQPMTNSSSPIQLKRFLYPFYLPLATPGLTFPPPVIQVYGMAQQMDYSGKPIKQWPLYTPLSYGEWFDAKTKESFPVLRGTALYSTYGVRPVNDESSVYQSRRST